jgi:hypothetical protein
MRIDIVLNMTLRCLVGNQDGLDHLRHWLINSIEISKMVNKPCVPIKSKRH